MFHPRDFSVFFSCVVLIVVRSSYGSEIVGGKEVKPHSLPFMALLESQIPSCGGVLINPSWVLTAAHCTDINKVLLGVHSIKNRKETSRQVQKVQQHFPHPKYDRTKKLNDLMLLKLNQPVIETKTVKSLKLGKTVKDPAAGSVCLVAGWGKTKYSDKKGSDVLMSVNVTVIDRKKCNQSYKDTPAITDSMICAGSSSKTEADTCQGDSGGPLLCRDVLVGITSFGSKKCDGLEKPGVYSFLSKKQLAWINKTMKSQV